MKILFLGFRFPYPPLGGDKMTALNLLREFIKLGNEVTLITLYESEEDLKEGLKDESFYTKIIPIKFIPKIGYLNAALGIFSKIPFIINYFYSPKMQKIVDKELRENNYDVIFCHTLRTNEYVKNYRKIPRLLFLTDVNSVGFKRRFDLGRSFFDKFKIYIEYKKTLKYEINVVKEFESTYIFSDTDKKFLSQYTDTSRVKTIPHGIDSNYFYYSNDYDKNIIVFIGNMRTVANTDAAIFFGEKILPSIKKSNPEARFIIVGAFPKKELFDMASRIEGIEITGQVDDVREYVKKAAVSVCPVRIAQGVQNKVLVSMSMGIPVITSSAGLEGINANSNELILADSEDEIIKSVTEIMNDPEKRQFYSINARKFIENHFTWPKVAEIINDEFKRISEKTL